MEPLNNFWDRFSQSSLWVKVAAATMLLVWFVGLIVIMIGTVILLEQPIRALELTPKIEVNSDIAPLGRVEGDQTTEVVVQPILPSVSAVPVNSSPALPTVVALENLAIRGGPGLNYPIVGFTATGQPLDVTGRTANGDWWQVRLPGASVELGWVSSESVTALNTANVPGVAIPLPPAPAPPPPAGPVFADWHGAYFSNPDLSGQPALERNEVALDLTWGSGAPDSRIPADNFSARWMRDDLYFNEGTYRFHMLVDGGARLWVDDQLVIDAWNDSGATREVSSGERYMSSGSHTLRVEYYDLSGDARLRLWWEHKVPYQAIETAYP